jgi:hypothetical protein
MNFNVGNVLADAERALERMGTDVTLTWNEVAAGVTPNPVDGSVPAANLTARTLTLPAMFHSVGVGTLGVKRFNVIEEGDVILDFPAKAPLDGKRDLVFWIQGKAYREKEMDAGLAQSWDVWIAGRKLFRTVLLKVQP